MTVAAVQPDVAWEDRKANLARLARRVDAAAALGARLVVLPEMFATGFSMDTAVTAEPPGGPTTAWLLERAAATGAWVCGTLAEAPEEGAGMPANMFVLAGPDGTLHRSAKLHPFSPAGEHLHHRPGTGPATFGVEGLRVTPLVCYDLRFADAAWEAGPGTDVFVVPANWPASRRDQWRTLVRARAIENQCYAVAANRVGEGGGISYAGDSCVVDFAGRTLVEAAEIETVVTAEIDPAAVAEARRRFNVLADRNRP